MAPPGSGDTVGVTGTLGPQLFAGLRTTQPGRRHQDVTFRGLAGNLISQLHCGSPNITYDGLNVDAGGAHTSGAVFENGGGDHLSPSATDGSATSSTRRPRSSTEAT